MGWMLEWRMRCWPDKATVQGIGILPRGFLTESICFWTPILLRTVDPKQVLKCEK